MEKEVKMCQITTIIKILMFIKSKIIQYLKYAFQVQGRVIFENKKNRVLFSLTYNNPTCHLNLNEIQKKR